jgi:hypothetical protein
MEKVKNDTRKNERMREPRKITKERKKKKKGRS